MTEADVVSVCVDCFYWVELGPNDQNSVWTEGFSGPVLLEGYWATTAADS